MNMVKSLLLGSAAGLIAVAGAQAADLPVKAKPVEYVKICSAYGAGFYYIPGTDICLRVGGYVWSEFDVNNLGAGAGDTATGAIGGDNIRNRNDDWTSFRVRFDMVFDARTNTEYGTLRSYASIGWQWTTNLDGFQQQQTPAANGNYAWYYDRAFIQFAGLTFGYVGSFFDFDPSLILSQQNSKSFAFTPAIAYTAQLGSGVSASVSVEDSTTRRTHITFAGVNAGTNSSGYFGPSSTINIGNNVLVVPIALQDSGFASNFYSGQYMPDFVANLRVDQAWGDAQVSGAAHQVKTAITGAGNLIYGPNGANNFAPPQGQALAPVKYGYAVLGGVNFKLPAFGAGDSIQFEGAWARGAVDYTGLCANPYSNCTNIGYRKGAIGPVLDLADSYIGNDGLQHLATAWSVNGQLRHFWTPMVRSSFAVGYVKYKAPAAVQFATGVVTNGQDIGAFPDGSVAQVTADLIWSPVPKLDLGVEAVWFQMKTDCGGLVAAACAADPTRGKTTDSFGGTFRARRDF